MNTMTAIASRKEKGFTLIELVMVIVILGILAAFALPRFADLGSEARISALNGATGAVKSAAGIAHSACLARAACTTDETATVDLDGTTINMANAYPEAAAGGIDVAAQIADDFILGTLSGSEPEPSRSVVISADDGSGAAQADCNFTYAENTGTVDATLTVTTGC